MKYSGLIAVMLLLVSCSNPRTYTFELSGEISEGPSEEPTASLDMYQDACDSDAEVFTSAGFNLNVEPRLVKEPGQADSPNELYVALDSVRIQYEPKQNAFGVAGPAIEDLVVTSVSQRDLKVNAQNETNFLFLTLDQKSRWREDQGDDAGEIFLYDYTMTLTFNLDADGNDTQEEVFKGTFEAGHFDKCD